VDSVWTLDWQEAPISAHQGRREYAHCFGCVRSYGLLMPYYLDNQQLCLFINTTYPSFCSPLRLTGVVSLQAVGFIVRLGFVVTGK
jgi:hypothetical protein